MAQVDVVVVSYNSSAHLRTCVAPLVNQPETTVIVVDNAPGDGSWESIADLGVAHVVPGGNIGFGRACNAGAKRGHGEYVLFLNPDARISPQSLRHLVDTLDEAPAAGIAGPKIVHDDGNLHFSQRRFPSLRRTFAVALFLHRLFPRSGWSDQMIRDRARYDRSTPVEWLSGACILVRRALFETLNGFDERFFLYCEDMDLCRRTHDAGFQVLYVAEATAAHVGGTSAPRSGTLVLFARSRVAYARKHFGRSTLLLDRIGLLLTELSRAVLGRGGFAERVGRVRAAGQIMGGTSGTTA